jgi:parvulin-like peptidyl-prolyl isomerase
MSELAKSNKKNTAVKVKNANSSFSPAVIITICVAVAILVGVIAWSVIARQVNNLDNKTVMQIGDTEVKGLEFKYFYNNAVSSFQSNNSSLISYLNIDFSKDLSTQQSIYEGMTWADYFSSAAQNSITETTLLYNEAIAKGYNLTDEDKASVDNEINTLAQAVSSLGYGVDYYLENAYGEGVNTETYKTIRYKTLLASKYLEDLSDSYEYSDEECENYYNEHKLDYDTATFRSYVFRYEVPEDAAEGDESYKDEARASANAMLEAITDEASFETYLTENVLTDEEKESVTENFTLSSNATHSTLSSDVRDWLFDSARVEGDKTVIDANNAFNVIYFISCGLDRYNTAEIRQIFIRAEEEEHDDSEEGAHEEAAEEAAAKAHEEAEKIYEEWKSGAATAESFGDLAITYSDDSSASNGGLLTNVYKNYFTVAEINDWVFASRNPGDSTLIDSDYGTHILYYVGTGDPFWQLNVRSTLATNEYSAYLEDLKTNANITVDEEVIAKLAK